MEHCAQYVLDISSGSSKKKERYRKDIQLHLQMLVFNIISLLSVIALIDTDAEKEIVISLRHLAYVTSKFNLSCEQSGGMGMASEYYGVSSGNYSSYVGQGQNTSMSEIDFDNNVARPSLVASATLTGGAPPQAPTPNPNPNPSSTVKKEIIAEITKVLNYNNAKVKSKKILNAIIHLIIEYLVCLGHELSSKSLKSVLKDTKFKILN